MPGFFTGQKRQEDYLLRILKKTAGVPCLYQRFFMRISKGAIKEFKEIYEAEFGVMLSDTEATEKALRLLVLFKNIYKPIKQNK